LVYLERTDTIWRCDNCLSYYDTKIQDIPIKNKSEFKLFAHSEHNPYAIMDVDDPSLPFIEGIDIDERLLQDQEQLSRSQEQRIQHIHVRGSFADSIRKGALSTKKLEQEKRMTKKGYKQTPEHIRKNSESHIRYYQIHPGYWRGRKQSESTIKKGVYP
jgi:hypothetical protein